MSIIFLRYSALFTITVLLLVLFSLILAHVFPGDLITNLSGIHVTADFQRARLETEWAINENPVVQFITYCQHLLHGNWGLSSVTGSPLYNEIARTLPATVELSLYAGFIAIITGVPMGCIAGIKAYTKVDYSINGLSIIQYSLPVFWLGLAFILIFCFALNIFPLSGRLSVLFNVPHQTGFLLVDILLADNINTAAAFKNALHHLVLPSIAVGMISGANLTRLVRRSVIDVLRQPYIASAKSRGLSFKNIFFNHVLRNALLPILPLAGIQITTLISNAMIIEALFSWPGVGKFLLDAIYQQDYAALRVGMLTVSIMIISLTIFADLLSRLIDPRKDRRLDVSI